jgi:hypothetical protein
MLLELSRYVVLSPVRAGMVAASSGPGAALGDGGPRAGPQWLEVSWLLARFGATRAAARAAYRRFVDDGVAATSPLDAVRGQIWLGGETFRTGMQEAIGEELLPDVPHPQMRPCGPTREELLAAVCEEFGVSEADLRSRAHQEAYRVAAYLLRRRGNLHREWRGCSALQLAHLGHPDGDGRARRTERWPGSRTGKV